MSSMGLTFGPQPQLRRDLARSRPLSQSTAFGSTGSLRWCATTLPSGPVPFSGKLTSPTSCRGLNERLLPPSLPTPRPTRGRGCWLSSRPFRVRGPTPGSGSARRVLTTCAFGALPVPSTDAPDRFNRLASHPCKDVVTACPPLFRVHSSRGVEVGPSWRCSQCQAQVMLRHNERKVAASPKPSVRRFFQGSGQGTSLGSPPLPSTLASSSAQPLLGLQLASAPAAAPLLPVPAFSRSPRPSEPNPSSDPQPQARGLPQAPAGSLSRSPSTKAPGAKFSPSAGGPKPKAPASSTPPLQALGARSSGSSPLPV